MAQGKAEGLAEGKVSIAKYTGLPVEEIEKL